MGTNLSQRIFAKPQVLRALRRVADNRFGRRALAALETRLLASKLESTKEPSARGGALGFLFDRYEPGRSPREIYEDVFAPARFDEGYRSQMAQDFFLNRWFFRNEGPGFFVDVGAFDGELGSNTYFFEKTLGWQGAAFEPNPPEFASLSRNRSCRTICGCAYDRDGEVTFLALSEQQPLARPVQRRPGSLSSLVLDPNHGALMLSGIDEHIDGRQRMETLRDAWALDQRLVTTPCYRIDTVLTEARVTTVDYLSIDVEGAELQVLKGIDFERIKVNVIGVEHSEHFPNVYDLLLNSGFEYHGLLFFDEIFVNRDLTFSWK